jgi:hypothetical protein
MVELGDMMDVDQDCGDTSFENASSAPEFKEPRPYDFVSDNEEGTFEEFQDEDMYYQTEDCESYMVLLDDDDHNVHDEEAEADEEENSDGNEPSVFEGKCGNDPRIGITMYDYEKFGHLAAGVRRYRKKWSILEQYRQAPERVRSLVVEHAMKCIEDIEYGKSWASKLRTPLTLVELSDIECDGVEPYVESRDQIVRDRQFLGDNMDPNSSAMNSSWSIALRPNLDDKLELEREILLQLEERLPRRELFPVADEGEHVDVDRVLCMNHDLPWLDDLRRYGNDGCANGADDNRQPVRRTVSIVHSDEYKIEDPINDRERERKVLDLNVYTCREMPPDAWMT